MARSSVNGVLVVDKPPGPTSHDVVARVRRALRTKSVGHAGTLDPMATGVLVLAVGEGTKLVPYLSADDKEYEARIAFGVETDTLDAEGTVQERYEVASLPPETVERAASAFVGRFEQQAPAVSAVKVRGSRLHERYRRGEAVEAPWREVEVQSIAVLEVGDDRIDLRIRCGKGFYVRSLARDLSRKLETVGHLASLRRTRSGPFTLDDALAYERIEAAAGNDDAARRQVRAAVGSLEDACSNMLRVELNERGREDARHGRPIRAEGCAGGTLPASAPQQPIALLEPEGRLVALGRREGDRLRVTRGVRT